MPSLVEIGPAILDFLISSKKVFAQFRNYLPLENGVALHMNQIEYPLTKDALRFVWLKLTQPMVLEKKIFKFRQCFFAIS